MKAAMKTLVSGIFGITLAMASTVSIAQELKPGMWELSTSMKMKGMALPAHTFKHCLTAADIASGKQHSMGDKDSKCAVTNMKSSAGSYSFDIACTSGQGKMTGSAKGTTSANSYTTEMKMRMTPDQGMGEMTQTVKGRLLGDCK